MSKPVVNMPRLSIIIATRNAERTFERCMHSITGQDFTDWEILIADGASTDNTVSLIRKHEAIIAWWQSKGDEGIYDAWNQAIARARGEYVCFLGADDAWADDHALARLYRAIGEQEYDLVTSSGLVINSATGKRERFGSAWDYQRIGRRSVVCHPGLLHRRSLFERYGDFDSHYRIAGDLDFMLRLPASIHTLHVDTVSTLIDSEGMSRRNVLARLREQREVLARCERYGPIFAHLVWIDKLWRYPLARLFHIPH